MVTDPFGVFIVLALLVYVAILLEERFRLFRSLGAALVGILFGMLLSNTGVLPGDSPAYDFLMSTGVSIGIAFILLSVDLSSILEAGPRMLGAFTIGAVGTAIGAILGSLVVGDVIGDEAWKLAGQYTGTYTGGGMNFAALGLAFETSSDLFTAATTADVIVTALWMAACLIAPVVLGRSRAAPTEASPPVASEGAPMTLERALHTTGRSVSIQTLALLLVIALGAVWVADWLGRAIPSINSVLWLTTIVLALAQFKAIRGLTGAAMLGNYLVLLFLASNGARSVIATIFEVGPAVFVFASITVAVHGVIIFGVGRAFRIDLATLAIASQANVGGAASAMALAGARGYGDRLLPGVAVGLLGYAAGNYSGFAIAALVRSWLGG